MLFPTSLQILQRVDIEKGKSGNNQTYTSASPIINIAIKTKILPELLLLVVLYSS